MAGTSRSSQRRSDKGTNKPGSTLLPGRVDEYEGKGKHYRSSLVARVRAGLDDRGLAVLCGQPLSGKTELGLQVLAAERSASRETYLFDLAGSSETALARRVKKLVRLLSQSGRLPNFTVFFDNVSSLDEAAAEQFARAVFRLVARSTRVILAITPESESALVYLTSPVIIQGWDLLLTDSDLPLWLPGFGSGRADEVRAHTAMLPSMVSAYASDLLALPSVAWSAAVRYHNVLESVAVRVLNELKVPDQRSLVCGMVALGSGNVSALVSAGLRVDDETLFDLAVAYPVLGVDPYQRSFDVVGASLWRFESCLRPDDRFYHDNLPLLVHELARRGDYRRALHIAVRYLNESDRAKLLLSWPLELVNVGGAALLVEAVAYGIELKKRSSPAAEQPSFLLARIVVDVLTDSDENEAETLLDQLRALVSARMLERGFELGSLEGLDANILRDAVLYEQGRLLVLARAQWSQPGAVSWQMVAPSLLEQGNQNGEERESQSVWSHVKQLEGAGLLRVPATDADPPPDPSADPLVVALRVYVCAKALLLEGNSADAFRLVIASGTKLDGDEVVSCLLGHLLALASCFCGDGRSFDAALSYDALESDELSALLAHVRSVGKTIGAYLQGGAPDGSDQILSKASARGDQVLHVLVYLALSMSDMRAGALRRSEARATHAAEFSARTGLDFFARVGDLVASAALLKAGRREEAHRRAQACLRPSQSGHPDALNSLVLFFAEAASGDRARIADMVQGLGASACPAGFEPLVALLEDAVSVAETGGEDNMAPVLPAQWSKAVSRWRSSSASDAPVGSFHPEVRLTEEGERMIRINVLGRLEVLFEGRVLGDYGRRRKAGALIALLAEVRGHSISRDDLMRTLWSGAREDRARERYYTCLSYLRKVLGGPSRGSDAYIQSSLGGVTLNTKLVCCDIDRLESTARLVSSRTLHGRDVVDACRELLELYQGDIFVPPDEEDGFFEARRAEVRSLFVDALAAGCEEVLRSGLAREALWIARAAYSFDDDREDIMECLVSALVLNREYLEAKTVYERYATMSIERREVLPSLRLRELYLQVRKELGEAEDERAHKIKRRRAGADEKRMSERSEAWSVTIVAEPGKREEEA